MNVIVTVFVIVAVFKTIRWLGAIWISGAEAHDDTQ